MAASGALTLRSSKPFKHHVRMTLMTVKFAHLSKKYPPKKSPKAIPTPLFRPHFYKNLSISVSPLSQTTSILYQSGLEGDSGGKNQCHLSVTAVRCMLPVTLR